MPTIDYQPIANGGGANVETQAQYLTDLAGSLINGYTSGVAQSKQVNKTLRQSSMIAAAIATFISQQLNQNVLDDGNLAALVTALTNAIQTGGLPSGVMLDYGGAAAPSGFLLCDGTSYLRATYPNLFTAIGTGYGSADGTHFNVPDYRGRSSLGAGTGGWVETQTAVVASGNAVPVNSNNSKWITGDQVTLSAVSGFTGTITNGVVYVFRVDATHVKFASTMALAQAGNPDITAIGTGSFTATAALTTRTIGEVGGEESHAQAAGEESPHTHGLLGTAQGGDDGSGNNNLTRRVQSGINPGIAINPVSMIAGVAGKAANVLHPILVATKIIKI